MSESGELNLEKTVSACGELTNDSLWCTPTFRSQKVERERLKVCARSLLPG